MSSLFGTSGAALGGAAAPSAGGGGLFSSGSKPVGSLFSQSSTTPSGGGSLFGSSTSGTGTGAAGSPPTPTGTGQGLFSATPPLATGGLFGAAGGKSSLFGAGSALSTPATTGGGAGVPPAAQSVTGSAPPSQAPSTAPAASGGTGSLFGAGQGATTGSAGGSSLLFGTSSSLSPPLGGSVAALTSAAAAEQKTGGLLAGASSSGLPLISSTGGQSDPRSSPGGAAQSELPTAARLPGAGVSPSVGTTAATGLPGAPLFSAAAPGGVTSSGGGAGPTGVLPSAPGAAGRSTRAGGKSSHSSSLLVPAPHIILRDAAAASGAASNLPPPQEVALETLQHELLEDVLAKWERRLERRVEQFITVAEEVDSVEKAMIEESRKIQQVMNEQGRLERKQIYTAGVIDSLEHQQRDLVALLRSIEGAVLELRCGGPRETSSAGKTTAFSGSYRAATAVGSARDAATGFRVLHGATGKDGPASIAGDSGGGLLLCGKVFLDQSAGAASMPLLSSAEQLALERLRSFDQQLAEVGQNLSYAAETFQAGSLGAVAQVLAVHQAALRAAALQAAHIEEQMRQLQEAWEVSKGNPDDSGGGGALRQNR